MMGVFIARVPVKEISYFIRRMVWFFLAIVTFPSSEDWMIGLDKLFVSLIQRFSVIRELLAVAVMAVKFLPMVFAETEGYFSSL
jgi:hypothetical protein